MSDVPDGIQSCDVFPVIFYMIILTVMLSVSPLRMGLHPARAVL